MNSRNSMLVGGALVLVGALALTLSFVSALLGINLMGFALRFWPIVVSAAGLLFVLPPILVRGKPGLGALFIPGVPILVTGGLLMFASVFDAWNIWAYFWPMEVLGLALGFLVAGWYMRIIWFLIPAIIIGLNGLVFQFCALTGLWAWWSVLWTIEPLAVGLPLLLIGLRRGSSGLMTAGMILGSIAAAGFVLMMAILGGGWLLGLAGPGLIILIGLAILVWGVLRPRLLPHSATE